MKYFSLERQIRSNEINTELHEAQLISAREKQEIAGGRITRFISNRRVRYYESLVESDKSGAQTLEQHRKGVMSMEANRPKPLPEAIAQNEKVKGSRRNLVTSLGVSAVFGAIDIAGTTALVAGHDYLQGGICGVGLTALTVWFAKETIPSSIDEHEATIFEEAGGFFTDELESIDEDSAPDFQGSQQ